MVGEMQLKCWSEWQDLNLRPHVPNVVRGLELGLSFRDFLGAIMGEKFSRRNGLKIFLNLFSCLGWWAL